jgi:hypothetical protein
MALSAWRMGDIGAARRWLETMAGDAETPPGARARVEMLLALAAGQGKS